MVLSGPPTCSLRKPTIVHRQALERPALKQHTFSSFCLCRCVASYQYPKKVAWWAEIQPACVSLAARFAQTVPAALEENWKVDYQSMVAHWCLAPDHA